MALDPVVNELREIAFSGAATLADIPFLAQRIKQEQTGQFGQTSPGLEAAGGGRGGGSGLGAGLFEPTADVGVTAGGGGGFSGVSSLENFAQAFSDRPASGEALVGGRGGPDAEGGDVSVAAADFSPTSEIGKALSAFAALTGIPAGPVANALSGLFGPFGVVGPSRPAIGTQSFSDVVGATQQAREINDRIEAMEGALGRDLSPAEQSIAEADFEASPSFDPGFGTGAPGQPGSADNPGPGTGGPAAGSPAGGAQAAAGQAPGTGARGGAESGGGGGGAGGGDGGPGGSGGGSGPGGPGGGAGEGRHIGGIVSEDERPGITAGDVPNQLLQEGEFIVRREAVQNIGEPFMDALNILAANFDPKKARNALRELLK